MSMMASGRVLIVEDDEPKLVAIERFLSVELPSVSCVVARSLSSAIAALVSGPVRFAIIDMSLPTYDFSVDKAGGGRPQGFGGADVVRFIEAECPETFSVVITQYVDFADAAGSARTSVVDLTESLRKASGDHFLGVIRYSGQQGDWQDELRECIHAVFGEGGR